MENKIYPTELQLDRTNYSNTKAPFYKLWLHELVATLFVFLMICDYKCSVFGLLIKDTRLTFENAC